MAKKQNPLPNNITAVSNENSSKNSSNVYILLVLVATLGLFLSGITNKFVVWDDPKYVFENLLITDPSFGNLLKLLKTVILLNYHPLTMFSLWLNAFLFGLTPTSFIVTNALIHTANTYLIFRLSKKLSNENAWIALFSALFWGIHPMHVESVTWISERKDVLYTLFFLGSTLYYIKFLETAQKKYYWLTFLLFIAACLSKAMAIVLPLTLILIDFWLNDKTLKIKYFSSKILFFAVSLLFFWISVQTLSGKDFYGFFELTGSVKSVTQNHHSLIESIAFGSYGLMVYLVKLFIPINLHHWYVYPNNIQSIHYLAIAGLFAFIFALYYSYQKNKTIFFGLSFFLINVILVLQFFPVSTTLLAERYTYLAYFGLIFMLIALLYSSKIDKKIVTISLCLVAGIFVFLSASQIKTWKNTLSLWENTYQYHPENTEIAISTANQFKEKGDINKTIEICENSIKEGANDYKLYHLLASCYINQQQYPKALANLQKTEQTLNNQDAQLAQTLMLEKGAVYSWMGQTDSAMYYLSKAQQNMRKP